MLLLDLTNGRPRTIDTGSDSIELGVDLSLTSGADLVIDGNLTVNGEITAITTEVLVADSSIFMNNGYSTVAGRAGGLAVNYLPTATTDTVNGSFSAGVAGVSNPTVVTTGAATFVVGDCIQIASASDAANNGLFEVLSHAANTLTIRGIGTSASTFPFFQNQFVTDATIAGSIVQITVSVIQSGTDGVWETGSGDNSGSITFVDLTTAAGSTLDAAYQAGNTITTSAADGDVVIAGTEKLDVTSTGGVSISNFLNLGGTAGVELTAAAGGLSTGELIQINASGEAALADNNTGTVSDSFAIGVSTANYAGAATAQIHTVQGALVPVLFGAAPAGASNGAEVFLDSTAGQATLTAPSGTNEVVYGIGILAGANGVLTTPNVLFIPRLVAVIP
jgi:hypothetical protein